MYAGVIDRSPGSDASNDAFSHGGGCYSGSISGDRARRIAERPELPSHGPRPTHGRHALPVRGRLRPLAPFFFRSRASLKLLARSGTSCSDFPLPQRIFARAAVLKLELSDSARGPGASLEQLSPALNKYYCDPQHTHPATAVCCNSSTPAPVNALILDRCQLLQNDHRQGGALKIPRVATALISPR